jgi:glycosyltransferase involved in cell wall biosynthesis
MSKPRLIVVGPLPPPLHGVAVSTSLVLGSSPVRECFDVEHLDTSDHRPRSNVGRWDLENIWLGVRALADLCRRLNGSRGVVYVPISQNAAAFLRDSLFIWTAHLRGWKVAAHLRGSDFQTFYRRSSRPLQKWLGWTLRRIDSVAVMGSTLRWVFDGLLPAERIAVVPNGTPEPRPSKTSADPDHVLFLSNLRQRKGVEEAVEAALLVRSQRPSTRFTFAGEWEDVELEERLRARTASENGGIMFRSAVRGREKDELLASAAVFLFPPVQPEGHPRVVLEALAAGVPIVTTDRGAIRETVVDGESGFVLDEPQPALLAERVIALLEDDGLRREFSEAAHRRYRERFTQEHADKVLADWLLTLT